MATLEVMQKEANFTMIYSRGSDPAPSITQLSIFLPINTENPILSRQLPESSLTGLLDRVHKRTFPCSENPGPSWCCVGVSELLVNGSLALTAQTSGGLFLPFFHSLLLPSFLSLFFLLPSFHLYEYYIYCVI